jgi:hypothetical protein
MSGDRGEVTALLLAMREGERLMELVYRELVTSSEFLEQHRP